MVNNNDNEGWSEEFFFSEIERKRQQVRDRLAVKDKYPLTFDEKINIKDVLLSLRKVKNQYIKRVYGDRPKVTPLAHPINRFNEIFPNTIA